MELESRGFGDISWEKLRLIIARLVVSYENCIKNVHLITGLALSNTFCTFEL
jgi:hypothetical protein